VAESADITLVWRGIEARLPAGWRLDSLRCASTGLSRGDRSDEWIAVAVGPDGHEVRTQATSPEAALERIPETVARSR